MFIDMPVMNGEGNGLSEGGAVDVLTNCQFEPGLLRPFIGKDNRKYCLVRNGQTYYDKQLKRLMPVYKKRLVRDLALNGIIPATNATLALRKDEWLQMDATVIKAARERLRAWGDLEGASSLGGFNGMSKMILEHETMSDPGEALVDMDGLTEGRSDAPLFQLEGLPLPITHSDFFYSSRRLAISRSTPGMPLDTAMAEAAGRRVAEQIEKTLIGITTGITYGTAADYGRAPTVYGYTNFPARVTKTDLTAPTSSNGTTIVSDVIAMRELLYANKFYGPFMLYVSTGYDAQLDNDLKAESDKTVRERIRMIDGIRDVRRLDYLTGNVMIMVQMTSDVARAINGMNITTVQWETKGGMQVNFKVMAIQVPQLRADYNGNCGICHGTTS